MSDPEREWAFDKAVRRVAHAREVYENREAEARIAQETFRAATEQLNRAERELRELTDAEIDLRRTTPKRLS